MLNYDVLRFTYKESSKIRISQYHIHYANATSLDLYINYPPSKLPGSKVSYVLKDIGHEYHKNITWKISSVYFVMKCLSFVCTAQCVCSNELINIYELDHDFSFTIEEKSSI